MKNLSAAQVILAHALRDTRDDCVQTPNTGACFARWALILAGGGFTPDLCCARAGDEVGMYDRVAELLGLDAEQAQTLFAASSSVELQALFARTFEEAEKS